MRDCDVNDLRLVLMVMSIKDEEQDASNKCVSIMVFITDGNQQAVQRNTLILNKLRVYFLLDDRTKMRRAAGPRCGGWRVTCLRLSGYGPK